MNQTWTRASAANGVYAERYIEVAAAAGDGRRHGAMFRMGSKLKLVLQNKSNLLQMTDEIE